MDRDLTPRVHHNEWVSLHWEQGVAAMRFDHNVQVFLHREQGVALYDYAGEAEGDLAFSAGDTINILDTSDPSGWWQGACVHACALTFRR